MNVPRLPHDANNIHEIPGHAVRADFRRTMLDASPEPGSLHDQERACSDDDGSGSARDALAQAQRAAHHAGIPAPTAEIESASRALNTPAARRISRGKERFLLLEEVEALLTSKALIVAGLPPRRARCARWFRSPNVQCCSRLWRLARCSPLAAVGRAVG